jgi:predicted alpha/beta superfamily hydrolase
MKPALLGTYLALLLVSSAVFAAEPAPMPKPAVGRIERLMDFASNYVSARNVDIWLPPGYSERQKYAVLYMHDGQMLFDAKTTWNKQEWQADEVAAKLMMEGKVRPFIIVGVHNAGKSRNSEYFPQKTFTSLSKQNQGRVLSMSKPDGSLLFTEPFAGDAYLMFLVQELKPFVDRNYSVHRGSIETAVMGSSRGGLISLYAMLEYPDVFGSAAALSSHWPIKYDMDDNPYPAPIIDYMRANLPDPSSHRMYFDYGTATLDALYPPLQANVDEVMREKGYNASNWQTLRFEGAEHSEKAWAARLDIPLQFLFPPRNED